MRILVAYAHPDDESFGPAATLARYARQGAAIYGTFMTRGEHGEASIDPPPPPHALARLREQDLYEATRLIGFRRIDLLGYEDGTLDAVPRAVLEQHVLDALLAYRPDVVITFGPAGITRHADHVAVHAAAQAAFHEAIRAGLGVRELYYDAVPPERAREVGLEDVPDGCPNTWIDVAETRQVQLDALRLHGRHVQDARERVEHLERQAPPTDTFHRAWPEVADGWHLRGFLEE